MPRRAAPRFLRHGGGGDGRSKASCNGDGEERLRRRKNQGSVVRWRLSTKLMGYRRLALAV